jgi:hypothetical protein
MDKVTREIRVDLTPAEIEARRQSLAENGLQLVSWEANRKAVLMPIDAEGKHLKETRKELAEAIETRKELRSVECAWYEEGTQRYLRRLDNGETIDQEPLRPEEILKARQTSLPLEETPPAPEAPEPPAPTREPLALPEHAGPGLTGEGELHEGGPLAPEAPTVHRALPAARHPDAIDAEVIEVEKKEPADVLRGMVLEILKGRALLWSQLVDMVAETLQSYDVSSPSERQLEAIVASMVKGGAVVYVDDRGLYQLPEASAVEEPAEANVQRALLAALPRNGSWMPEEALAAVLQGDMPGLTIASLVRCLVDLRASGKVERKYSGKSVLWCLLPEAPKAKPSKGKASKPAPKKAKGKGRGSKAAEAEAAHLAAYEAECRALVEEPSSPRALVVRALEGATKRRSVRALATATGLGFDPVRGAIIELLDDGVVVQVRRGGYELASKAESRPSKGKAPAPKAPPPCPPPPATGHPQRVLRGWVYDRVAHTGALPLETLQKESPGYHQEYIEGVVDLLLACECLHLTAGLLRALELPSAPTVDQAVLDEVAGILRDAPLTSAQIAKAFEVHHVIIFDVLQELRDAGRVALRGDAWHLTHGASEAEEAA